MPAAAAEGSDSDSEPCVELGDFILFVQEITQVTREIKNLKPQGRRDNRKPRVRRVTQSSLRSAPRNPKYQVFLGGSCNPTTWRFDHSIPAMEAADITYYNPQVDDWSPKLVELEQQAKDSSDWLFFVIDNQTRGIASMVELAFLAGSGREMLVVMMDFDDKSVVNGVPLSQREVRDLNRGHDFLCSILHRECIPLFEDVATATSYLVDLVNKRGTVADLNQDAHVTVPVFRGFCIFSGIFTAHKTFSHYDHDNAGTLSVNTARLALRSYFDVNVSGEHVLKILAVLRNGDMTGGDQVTRSEFCCIVADILTRINNSRAQPQETAVAKVARAAWNALSPLHSILPFASLQDGDDGGPMARDVFLGGSCLRGTGSASEGWRDSVAIPLLKKQGFTYYDPDVDNWTPLHIPLESEAKAKCKVLLFFMTADTRAIGSMVEAAHFIGEGARKIVLCIHDVQPDTTVAGSAIDEREAKDLNRGRFYLADCANRNGIRIFTDIRESIDAVIEILDSGRRPTRSSEEAPDAAPSLMAGHPSTSRVSDSDRVSHRQRIVKKYDDLGV